MFSGADAPWHWLIIAILVIALFGYKKLPDAARSLGRSLRIFKTEIKGMNDDDAARSAAKAEIVAPTPPVQPVQPAPPAESAETPAQSPAPLPVESEHKPAG
ncbi:MAG TPA: Sec-independent protein translocase subunit TatA [Jatrophihabitantaceae bacterium]|nr:Sec-independent protein translocase subunit TatA [Jatrophihabitantaceae bacterium]